MTNLPASKVTQSRPFHRVGIEFSGPFMSKYRADRRLEPYKLYVYVFV